MARVEQQRPTKSKGKGGKRARKEGKIKPGREKRNES